MPRFDLHPADALLLVVDVQERFAVAIPEIAAADHGSGRDLRILIRGCALLGVSTVFSEQVPDKLGPSLPDLLEAATPEATVLAKSAFSCGDDPALRRHLADSGCEQIIVCGIEAHICVLATVADLVPRGWEVIVAADAVASRDPAKAELARSAARDLGALVLPVESILFRLQREAGVGCFKDLSRLVR